MFQTKLPGTRSYRKSSGTIHPNAALAVEAAEAAGSQGKFWEMHDLLFEHGDALLPADLSRYAAELALDVPRFEHDLREGRFGLRVAQDIDSADAAGVVGTPTFFINEVLYRGARTLDALEREIEASLTLEHASTAAADEEPEE